MDCPIVVHFLGGALGGEVRVMSKHDMFANTIRIPVILPLQGAMVSYRPDDLSFPPSFSPQYTYDEYRIERTIRENEYEARWVRPKDCSAELACIKAKLADAEEALDALKKLRKWFQKHG